MKRTSAIFLLLLSLSGGMSLNAQKKSVLNLPKYDSQYLHFGFSLGVNRANFIVHPVKNLASLDTVLSILPSPSSGFNLAIISDLRIHQYATLRFLPDLSFQERILNYSIVSRNASGGRDTSTFTKHVESTVIDFPLDLKIRSSRLNNISCYVLGGGKYSIDLASQKNVQNSNSPSAAIVKLKKNDYSFEAGFGIDYYFPYFKFSTEIKACWGIPNLLVKDQAIFSNSVDKLNSQLILISFNFEG
ncbi:MAG TPA: outer membrane beta-barrel protein [Bacteroidia bacterium]|jgi:hypothetical protein